MGAFVDGLPLVDERHSGGLGKASRLLVVFEASELTGKKQRNVKHHIDVGRLTALGLLFLDLALTKLMIGAGKVPLSARSKIPFCASCDADQTSAPPRHKEAELNMTCSSIEHATHGQREETDARRLRSIRRWSQP